MTANTPHRAAFPAEVFIDDACIIEEQPDHLVLAVRFSKAFIRENLAFLAALAEHTAPENSGE